MTILYKQKIRNSLKLSILVSNNETFLVAERVDCPLICSEFAYCARNGSSFECVCTRGYNGDGHGCIGKGTLVNILNNDCTRTQIRILNIRTQTPYRIKAVFLLYSLLDQDECTVNNGGCQHMCINSPHGSYQCLCNQGFFLHSDRRQCRGKIQNYRNWFPVLSCKLKSSFSTCSIWGWVGILCIWMEPRRLMESYSRKQHRRQILSTGSLWWWVISRMELRYLVSP